MSRNRIDVHTHVVPPFWAEALPAHGGDPSGWNSPQWSPAAAIAFMDSLEIKTSVLSLTAPGVTGWEGEEQRLMARNVNEYTTSLVAQYPGRFGNFATLPLPDVDGALSELAYSLVELKADGVVLFSNYDGTYLGDPAFEPLWKEIARRGTIVFVHPAKPPIVNIEGMPGPMVDYPFDTTRTSVHMVLSGLFERYPDLKVILSHAGGFLPYASERFAELAAVVQPGRSTTKLLAQFKRFYFDTALSGSSAAMSALEAFAAPGHILYGSDFPYAPASVGRSFTSKLDAYIRTAATKESVDRVGALCLFPRLA